MIEFLNDYIFISLHLIILTILYFTLRITMYLVNMGLLTNIISYYFTSIIRIIIFCYLIYEVFPIHNVYTNSFIIGLVWLFYWIPSLIATREFLKNRLLIEENKKLLIHDTIVQSVSIIIIMLFASNIYNYLTEIGFLNQNMSATMTFIFKEKIIIHLVALVGLYVTFDSYRVIIFRKNY